MANEFIVKNGLISKGPITVSGSLNISGSATQNLTASYAITASHALNASDSDFTAAGISGSWQNQTSSMSVLSASYATTASYALNASDSNFTAAGISGSWQNQTSSMSVLSASYATTASHALNAGGDSSLWYDGTTYFSSSKSILVEGNITASGNISSSGTITGATGSFTYLQGSSPINIISPTVSTLNNTSIVEVTASNQFPSPLAANTIYIVRGEIQTSTALTVTNDNVAIRGLDRNKDKLVYTGTGPFITTTDTNFSLSDLQLKSSGSILMGSNIDVDNPANNNNRVKVLEIRNCEIRNTNDVWKIIGYELVDISNTLMWYITGSQGCQFQSNRHLEITSCEMFNWQDEATGLIYAPSQSRMIELLPNTASIGTAVVNINSSIIHPIISQSGLFVDTASTTRFGTVASNTFIDVNLNTAEGSLLAGSTYDSASMLNYDVGLNQGLANSISYGMGYFTGTQINLTSVSYIPINVGSFTEANAQRTTISGSGEIIYNGTKNIYVDITGNISITQEGGGQAQDYTFSLYKSGSGGDVFLSGSEVLSSTDGDATSDAVPISFATNLVQGDKISVYQTSTQDFNITRFNLSIKE